MRKSCGLVNLKVSLSKRKLAFHEATFATFSVLIKKIFVRLWIYGI